MKRLFALGLTMLVVAVLGCGEDKRPTSVFIPDGLTIDSPIGTRYHYLINYEENDPAEDWTAAFNLQGETSIPLGFFLVIVFRNFESTEGNVTVTWAQGEVQIEDIKPGDNCAHYYWADEYPTIYRFCESKGFPRVLE